MDSDKHLILAFSLLFALICMTSRGQFNDSSSGLLSCPSVERVELLWLQDCC